MSEITLTLIGKPGCHLCDDARVVVNDVVAHLRRPHDSARASSAGSLAAPRASRFTIEEFSVDDDPALFAEYGEQIPVLLINGKVHNFWRIDPVRLTNSLKGLS